MIGSDWRPTASLQLLRQRANLFKKIRSYFDKTGAMEVDTPMLSHGATVDPYIESFGTQLKFPQQKKTQPLYLHSSPEFAMKRLLAFGCGDIYSLGHVFRNGDVGRLHNPEFTLLEWYRTEIDYFALMEDVTTLLHAILGSCAFESVSYQALFEKNLGFNPHAVADEFLVGKLRSFLEMKSAEISRNDCLDLLFSHFIEPMLGQSDKSVLGGTFVYDYPSSMAALAQLGRNPEGYEVARRFELFIGGVEIANGYYELTDACVQRQRFMENLRWRESQGAALYPMDEHVLGALQSGVPPSSGVALGVDRLLMCMTGKERISDVMAFAIDRA